MTSGYVQVWEWFAHGNYSHIVIPVIINTFVIIKIVVLFHK